MINRYIGQYKSCHLIIFFLNRVGDFTHRTFSVLYDYSDSVTYDINVFYVK